MNYKLTALCIVSMMTVSACSLFSSSDGPRCYFPDDDTVDAPLWLCERKHVQDYLLKTLKTTERFPQNFSAQKNLLIEQGGVELYQRMIEYLHKSMMTWSHFDDLTYAEQQFLLRTLRFEQQFQLEVRMVRNRTSPNKILYAVIALSEDSVRYLINETLAKYQQQWPDQWQRLEVRQDQLIDDIVRQIRLDEAIR